jgi:tetratricopeptide (TPR) repeat protein
MRKDQLSFRKLAVSSLAAALVLGAWTTCARAASATAEMSTEAGVDKPGIRNPVQYPGQLSTLFKISDEDPESSVPTAVQRDGNPIEFGYFLQDVMAKAETAAKRNDHQSQLHFLRALALAVPDQAKGWSLLCAAYEKANDRQRAINACKYAIDREGAEVQDFMRFVHLIASKEGELDNDERIALHAVLAHVDEDPAMIVPGAQMHCEAGVKLKDEAAMAACTKVLAQAAPNDPKTIVFQWSLAMMRGKRDDARQLVDRAKTAGLTTDAIDRMNDLMSRTRWSSRGLVGVGAFGAGAAVLLFLLLRRRMDLRRFAASSLPRT